MNNKLMLNYLADLSANNNREWYHEHKKENKIAFEQFEQLVQELINGIGTFDQSVLHNVPKELTFKLVRDTRFSTINRHIIQHLERIFLLWGNFLFQLDII